MGNKSIKLAGAAIVWLAMILNSRKKKIDGHNATPKTLNAWLRDKGWYKEDKIIWGSSDSLGVWLVEGTRDLEVVLVALADKEYDVILELKTGHYRDIIIF